MKELVEAIAKALVDNPEQVQVRAVEGEQVTVLELRVHHPQPLVEQDRQFWRSIDTLLARLHACTPHAQT